MPGWDSYRAVYGAELRAAAREFTDHGWPVVIEGTGTLLLVTGRVLDVLEVPAAIGRAVCRRLRDAEVVAPVAANPTGAWWFPVTAGAVLPDALTGVPGVVLHAAGDAVAAPPSRVPDGWVHWRVSPVVSGYRLAPADLVFSAAAGAIPPRHGHTANPGAQRPAGAVAVRTRS